MRRNKKGFTLVEVIVVLVILAILAAILIPSMVGWIDEANNKSAIVSARTEVLALQTKVSEKHATTSDYSGTITSGTLIDDATKLAGLGSDVVISSVTVTDNQVKAATIKVGKKTVTYTGTEYTVA